MLLVAVVTVYFTFFAKDIVIEFARISFHTFPQDALGSYLARRSSACLHVLLLISSKPINITNFSHAERLLLPLGPGCGGGCSGGEIGGDWVKTLEVFCPAGLALDADSAVAPALEDVSCLCVCLCAPAAWRQSR